ncbi:MAG TPA: zf-HC2 domain-containing protein [Ignavibacteriaceae bacterium]|nr:zf-HC2 domain-containing protein [Ignavibacteriaceae bacterium]
MNHKKYKEWIQLFLFDELTQKEKDELNNHLDDCNECSAEFEKQKKFFSTLKSSTLPEPDQNLLSEARREFNAALRVEKSKGSSFSFPKINLSELFFSPLKIAFGGTAVLAVGIIIGFLLFSQKNQNLIPISGEENNLASLEDRTQITNLRFIDQDPSDGEIEFIIDAIKPVHVKGKVSDPQIQSILTYSMLYEQNPGVRLNAINLIKTNAVQNNDDEIKTALITVAKYDTNLGVRREGLKLLRSFPFDSEVREALLYILLNDKNSAMRIEAISSLKEISEKGIGFNQDEISAFKENLNKEENNFVKFQIKSVLQENIKNEK